MKQTMKFTLFYIVSIKSEKTGETDYKCMKFPFYYMVHVYSIKPENHLTDYEI